MTTTSESNTAGRDGGGSGDRMKPNNESNSKDLMSFDDPTGSVDEQVESAKVVLSYEQVDDGMQAANIKSDELSAIDQQLEVLELDSSKDNETDAKHTGIDGDNMNEEAATSEQSVNKLDSSTDNLANNDTEGEKSMGNSSAIEHEDKTQLTTLATNGTSQHNSVPEQINPTDPTDVYNVESHPVKGDRTNMTTERVSDAVITDTLPCVENGQDIYLVSESDINHEENGVSVQGNADNITSAPNGHDLSPPAELMKSTKDAKINHQFSRSSSGDEIVSTNNGQDIASPTESEDNTMLSPKLSSSLSGDETTCGNNGENIHLGSDPIKIDGDITPKLANLLITKETTCATNGQDNKSSSQMIIPNDNVKPLDSKCIPSTNDAVFQNRLGHDDRDDSMSQLSLTDSESFQLSDTEDDVSMCSSYDGKSNEKALPDWLEVGVAVVVGNKRRGIVKFIGNTAFKPGLWVGVALDANVGELEH